MSFVMPVSAWISAGIVVSGFTRVDHSEVTSKPSISMTAISVTRSQDAAPPVVSRSTIASGASSRSSGEGRGMEICTVPRTTLPGKLYQLPKLMELPERERGDRDSRDDIDASREAGAEPPAQPTAARRQDDPPRGRTEEYAEHDPRGGGVVAGVDEAEAREYRRECEDG